MHGQVTHALSLHSFECWSLVSSYVGGSVFFAHPTRSLLSLFPSPLSQDTSVSDTSVSPGQVSTTPTSVGVISKSLKYFFLCIYIYTSILPSFTLVYSQTHSLEARLWASEVTANSPLSKKRALQCLLLFESFETAH